MSQDIRFIKYTVYLMGIAMAIGVIVIALTIYKRHLAPRQENWQQLCASQQVKTNASIKQASIFEDKIVLLTESLGHKQEVIIMDYCTGQYINSHEIIIKK